MWCEALVLDTLDVLSNQLAKHSRRDVRQLHREGSFYFWRLISDMAQIIWPLNGQNEQRGRAASVQLDGLEPLLGGKGLLHHLGFVVSSISAVAEEFAASVSARWDGEIIHDPIQRVRVAFFSPADTRVPVLELVEPASDVSPVNDFLKKQSGFHHVCYEIDDLEKASA